MGKKSNIAIFHHITRAYEHYCRPLCRELDMPQMAFDILMFLANNPESCTAKDISRGRGYRENILSVNINKLVSEGYLERAAVAGDRRKVRLVCTEKAQPIIARGQKALEEFHCLMKEGLSAEDMEICQRCLEIVGKNAERIEKIERTGEGSKS